MFEKVIKWTITALVVVVILSLAVITMPKSPEAVEAEEPNVEMDVLFDYRHNGYPATEFVPKSDPSKICVSYNKSMECWDKPEIWYGEEK